MVAPPRRGIKPDPGVRVRKFWPGRAGLRICGGQGAPSVRVPVMLQRISQDTATLGDPRVSTELGGRHAHLMRD